MTGALKSIDLFKNKEITDEIIENIIYDLEYINFIEGSKLFDEGDNCDQIFIIMSGTVDILMKYGIADIYADTIYSGCSIGTYTLLNNDKYYVRGEATSDVLALSIKREVLEKHAKQYPELKRCMEDFELYITEHGPPFFDYKLYKGHLGTIHVLKRLQQAVKRLIRINKSYKYAEGTNARANYQVDSEGINKLTQRNLTQELMSDRSYQFHNQGLIIHI